VPNKKMFRIIDDPVEEATTQKIMAPFGRDDEMGL
jgi:hypothetical protein